LSQREVRSYLVEAAAALVCFLAREVAQAVVLGLGVAALRVIEGCKFGVSIEEVEIGSTSVRISHGATGVGRDVGPYLFHRGGSSDTKPQPW
jgi:hypothetical protein